ncbi:F-box protein [Morus notabilis]|uniref:F-box protein n=2 Tax=Morus notabilis TaxID=981085 RepID=W9RCB4_9ROSA|nr:F-box protein [Morus notabilis]
MATFLPLEIIVDILYRLPVNDLLRYRCVSKQWRSLIDGPDFIKLHLNHSKQSNSNLAAVLFNKNDILRIDLDSLGGAAAVKLNHPIDDGSEIFILGSCNGLVALLNFREDVVFWNPSTRKYRKLPASKDVDEPSSFYYHGFHFYGFGHDPINDDYKLVKITQFHGELEDSFESDIAVYTTKTDSWRSSKIFLPYLIDLKTPNGVLLGNALHWVASKQPQKSDSSESIVAFDLVTEQYIEIPKPEYWKNGYVEMFLDVLGSSLCVTCNYFMEIIVDMFWSRRVDIWVMKEYGVKGSWNKMFTVEPSEAIGIFGYLVPFAYLKSGDQVILHTNERFILYDLRRKRAKNVSIRGLPEHFGMFSCMASLVELNGGWDRKKKKQERQKKDHDAKQR